MQRTLKTMTTIEARASELAGALNDIADLLEMPTDVTPREIVNMAANRWANGVRLYECSEAIDDIADLLDMPTGSTPAEIRTMAGNRWASGMHSCHDQCSRSACVLRRERDGARSEVEVFRDRILWLEVAIYETLMENLHLADGDNCTLLKLKYAIGFEIKPE